VRRDPHDPASGDRGGAIALGYAALTIVTAYTVFRVSGNVSPSWQIKPNLQSAVVTMGIVYPVVFGAIGGFLGR
ncbi:MAG: hypothetical protein ABEJ55_02030, partial [Halanaeroarchaeum sp.]